jgi:hypothetical protein
LISSLALIKKESLDGIKLFFLELQERHLTPAPLLKERLSKAPLKAIEKKVYDGALAMDNIIMLQQLIFLWIT